VTILKLNDEEARTLAGSTDPEQLRSVGVPEVLLTLGSHGSVVITAQLAERVAAVHVEGPIDPTGAGDTFSATYLAKRADGADPVEAARAAAEAVSSFLAEPS
jgi:sugar/nucleoside kinase (ribokinase family)